MTKEYRDINKFTAFLRPCILKIWKDFDRNTMRRDDFLKKYPEEAENA